MNDLKFAFRQLLKSPGFTAVAVVTLALGIGVNTSMFSMLQATLMRPLAYPEANRLVRLYGTSPSSRAWPHSVANFVDYQIQSQAFERMAALAGAAFNLAEPGQPAEHLRGLQVSADIFPLLGIQPTLGRWFSADEEQAGRNGVAILGHRFWLSRLAGDTNILGRTLRLDGDPVTVVGVMPAEVNDPRLSGSIDVWRPIVFADTQRQNRGLLWLECVARLKPGVSLAQAQAEMDALSARLAKGYPDSNSGIGVRLVPLAVSDNENGRRIVWLIMGLAGFVLLIACANLANLQLARTAGRTRELAIRSALGGTRRRVLRHLLTESLLIALLGGLLGVALANWSNALLTTQIPKGDEIGIVLRLNLKVLGFAFAATSMAGLAFGLIPAWTASRANINNALKQGSRGTTSDRSQHRMRHALVVSEVALALVLLSGAGVVLRGLHRFASIDPGWRVDGLTLGYIGLPDSKYASDERRLAFVQSVREKLAALPGVERVAFASELPIRRFNSFSSFVVDGQPEPPKGRAPLAFINRVTPGYLETLGMRLVAGRDFITADTTNSPAVAVINETMARTFWPSESPIGRRIGEPGHWREIVGVVSDVRFPANLDEPTTRFQTYRPLAQEPQGYLAITLRGQVTASTLRKAVADLDPDLPVNDSEPARVAVEQGLSGVSIIGKLLGGFAVLGLLLSALGIYGVIAAFVAQRRNEIGVRLALGAQRRDVLWLVVGRGLRLTLLGAAIGVIGAYGVGRLLASVSPELASKDPFTFLLVTTLLVAVAILACWLPARRAARVDPMVALRTE